MNKLYGLLALGLLLFGCAEGNYSSGMAVGDSCHLKCSTNKIVVGSGCAAQCMTQDEYEKAHNNLMQGTINLASCIQSSSPQVDALLEKYRNRTVHVDFVSCHTFPTNQPTNLENIKSFEILADNTDNIIYNCGDAQPRLMIEYEGKYYWISIFNTLCNGAYSKCSISHETIHCIDEGITGHADVQLPIEKNPEPDFPTINISLLYGNWTTIILNTTNYTPDLENDTFIPVSGEWDCDDDEAFTSMDGKPKCIRCEGGNLEVLHYDYGVTYNCDGALYISGVLGEDNTYSEFWR